MKRLKTEYMRRPVRNNVSPVKQAHEITKESL